MPLDVEKATTSAESAEAPEITSAMIDAGAKALRSFDPLDWCEGYVTAEELVEAVLLAAIPKRINS